MRAGKRRPCREHTRILRTEIDKTERWSATRWDRRRTSVNLLPSLASVGQRRPGTGRDEQGLSAGPPLRIVVNCARIGTAGRILYRNGPQDLETFRTVLEVSLLGTFNVLRLSLTIAPGIVDTAMLAGVDE